MTPATPTGFRPGFHSVDYHADNLGENRPSLSSSIAKTIVSETPRKAWLAHPKLNPGFEIEYDDKFDLGDAVHDTLSSGGARVYEITGFSDYRKEGARTERDKARELGLIPLLEHQAEQVTRIVSRTLGTLVNRDIPLGDQEAVFVAEDRGVLIRAMMDSFAPPWINDFKLSAMNLANDGALGRHIADMGYDLSAAFYLRIAGLVFPELAGRLKFRWLFLEKDEPHGLRIIEADATCLEMGRRKYEHALGVWQKCLISDRWAHLEHLPSTVPYPSFAETAWLEREEKPGFVQGPLAALKQMEGDA